MHNTEDKEWWVREYGEEYEKYFVENIAARLKIPIRINPEKATNIYAPDLIKTGRNRSLVDLKCQSTPFFKAEILYGFDPSFTVTFNKKDYDRYKGLYPDISVIFWVHWSTHRWLDRYGKIYTVQPVSGVWWCKLEDITGQIENEAPLHEYGRRKHDVYGNAKYSYLLDLRDMYFYGNA